VAWGCCCSDIASAMPSSGERLVIERDDDGPWALGAEEGETAAAAERRRKTKARQEQRAAARARTPDNIRASRPRTPGTLFVRRARTPELAAAVVASAPRPARASKARRRGKFGTDLGLYKLAEAMGTHGDDDIRTFEPLLDEFLAIGGSIDVVMPTLSTRCYNGKTLAVIACNWDVNAPRCLRACLARGADVLSPLDMDAEGDEPSKNPSRFTAVYAATITATVAGTGCDRTCLDILASHGGEAMAPLIAEARVKRMIYDTLRHLREGKDVQQRRKMYRKMFKSGFESSWGCEYSPSDVAKVLAPMTVVPLRVLRERKAIPRSSERPTVGTEHVPDGAPVVFFSQRWLTAHMDAAKAHPDDKSASKWRTMVETMETAVEQMQAAESQGRLGLPQQQ
jgi:hypothetical protein